MSVFPDPHTHRIFTQEMESGTLPAPDPAESSSFLKSPIAGPAGTGQTELVVPPSPDINLHGAGEAPGEEKGLDDMRKASLTRKDSMPKVAKGTPRTPGKEGTPVKEEVDSWSEYSTEDSDLDFVGQPPAWTPQYGYHTPGFQPCAIIFGSKKKAHQRAKAKRLARKLTDGSQWECEQCSNTNLITTPSCTACDFLDLDMLEVGKHVVKRVQEEEAERRKKKKELQKKQEEEEKKQREKEAKLKLELETLKKNLAERVQARNGLRKAKVEPTQPSSTPGKEEAPAAVATPPTQNPVPKSSLTHGKDEGVEPSPPSLQERREPAVPPPGKEGKEGERRRRRDRDEDETRRRKDRRVRDGERRMKKDKRRDLDNESVSSTEAVPVPRPSPEPRTDDRRRRRRGELEGKDFNELRHLSQMISATLKGQVEGGSETRRRRKKMEIDESDTADAVSTRRRDRKRQMSRSESPQPQGKRRRDQGSGATVLKREEKRVKIKEKHEGAVPTPESARSRRKEERRQRLLAVVQGCEEVRPDAAKPGVNKGVVHYIATGAGTHRWVNPYTEGLINASASSVGLGDVSHALNYRWDNSCRFATAEFSEQTPGAGSKPSYVAFDFTDYEVLPTHYSVSHAADLPRAFLRSWSLRGSGDNYRWDILSKHTNDDTISEACTSAQFRISIPESPKFYRYFMIRLEPQGSSSATNQLVANCFELYGYVRRREADSSRP